MRIVVIFQPPSTLRRIDSSQPRWAERCPELQMPPQAILQLTALSRHLKDDKLGNERRVVAVYVNDVVMRRVVAPASTSVPLRRLRPVFNQLS
jgi:hypothetical protein